MTTTSPTIACNTAAKFLAILKNQATHELTMPDASIRVYRAFVRQLDDTLALCASKAPSVDDCAEIEAFLSDVANAVLDGGMFPEAPRYWKQAFFDAIEIAGMACADVTGSLDSVFNERDVANTLH